MSSIDQHINETLGRESWEEVRFYLFIYFSFFVTLVIYYMFDAENLCIGYMNWASSYFLKMTSL